MSSSAASLLAIAATLLRRLRPPRYPQDAAFYAFSRFGPSLRLPPVERIRSAEPSVDSATVARWIEEFARVEREIWRLAERGGPARLGEAAVTATLREAFPFLVDRGLERACFLVAYYAAHEGYDR
jgi:hypothetical protein